MTYFVYTIANSKGRTYTGYTVSLERRLRQHCGELVGGARSTQGCSSWQYIYVITCPTWSASDAMKLEYLCKHPTRRRKVPHQFKGINGKVAALREICDRTQDHVISIYLRDDLLPVNLSARVYPLSELDAVQAVHCRLTVPVIQSALVLKPLSENLAETEFELAVEDYVVRVQVG